MKWIKEIFSEENGRMSSNRVMFVIGLLWSMFMTTAIMFINKGASIAEVIAFFSATSAIFVALKLGQKPMENKQL